MKQRIQIFMTLCLVLLQPSHQANASILPWDDWFYHLSHRREEVRSLHSKAQRLFQIYTESHAQYKLDYNDFIEVYGHNNALIFMNSNIALSPKEMKAVDSQIANLPEPVEPEEVLNVVGKITAIVPGLYYILPGLKEMIWNGGKLIRNGIVNATEGSSEFVELASEPLLEGLTESGTEAASEVSMDAITTSMESAAEGLSEGGVEAMIDGAASSVAESVATDIAVDVAAASSETAAIAAGAVTAGIGVVIFVGIDAIFGAIEGAKERDELDEQIDKLKKNVAKAAAAVAKVRKARERILKEMRNHVKPFVKATRSLLSATGVDCHYKIEDQTFSCSNVDENLNDNRFFDHFMAAQSRALITYSDAYDLKKKWVLTHLESFNAQDNSCIRENDIQSYLLNRSRSVHYKQSLIYQTDVWNALRPTFDGDSSLTYTLPQLGQPELKFLTGHGDQADCEYQWYFNVQSSFIDDSNRLANACRQLLEGSSGVQTFKVGLASHRFIEVTPMNGICTPGDGRLSRRETPRGNLCHSWPVASQCYDQ